MVSVCARRLKAMVVLSKEGAVVLILSGLAVLVHLWNAQALVLVVEADVG